MIKDQIRLIPKAEIHVHLEGSVGIDLIEKMAAQAGLELPGTSDELLFFNTPAEFFGHLDWLGSLVERASQLEEIAYCFSKRMSEEGVCYADVIVSPVHWKHWKRKIPDLIVGLDRGFSAAEADDLAPVGLCMSISRQQSSEEAIEFTSLLCKLRHPRVVALSLDGDESVAGRSSPRFAEAFRRAEAVGLRKTAHAGASCVPESMWDAIEFLNVDRIDHGYHSVKDEQMIAHLAEWRIPLGLCPTSNIRLGQIPSIDAHPIETLRRAGVPVSINTDDPAIFGITLTEEYKACADAFGWSDEIIWQIAETSIEASFANDDLKASLRRRLQDYHQDHV